MKTLSPCLVMLALLLVTPCAFAQKRADGSFLVSGLGATSCGQYLLAMQENTPNQVLKKSDGTEFLPKAGAYREWTQGFMAAYSAIIGSQRSSSEINGVMLWVKAYCEKDPTAAYVGALNAYMQGAKL